MKPEDTRTPRLCGTFKKLVQRKNPWPHIPRHTSYTEAPACQVAIAVLRQVDKATSRYNDTRIKWGLGSGRMCHVLDHASPRLYTGFSHTDCDVKSETPPSAIIQCFVYDCHGHKNPSYRYQTRHLYPFLIRIIEFSSNSQALLPQTSSGLRFSMTQ